MRIKWAVVGTIGAIAACSAVGGTGASSEETDVAESAITVSTYMLRGVGGKCMTVNGSGAQGDRIVLKTCTAGAAQRFQMIKSGAGYELRAFGRCVDVTGASFKNGTPLQLYPCNAGTAQRFEVNGDRIRPLVSNGSLAVEVAGGVTTDGTQVQLYQHNLSLSQAWKAVPLGITPNATIGVPLTSASIPTCTSTQVRDWDVATIESEGAKVSDPTNERIGLAWARRAKHYYPVSGNKETMCGNFDRFGAQTGWTEDSDWNIHMVPTRQTFLDLKNRYGGTDRDELEAEIFVDQKYWSRSPWFHIGWKQSPLAKPVAAGGGHPICAYGPYVSDRNHDGEPFDNCRAPCGKKIEIHPSEFLWWRDFLPTYRESIDRLVSTEYMTFLHLQDNSGDFDDPEDFNDPATHQSPVDWEPWSNSPLHGLVRIPWRYAPGGAKTEMRIVDDFVSNVVTPSHAADAADQTTATEQTLAIDGTIVLRVSETTDLDANLGVKLNETGAVCRRPDSNEVLGFVSIRDTIGGNDDKDTEGTHVFSVAKSTISSGW